MTLEPKVATLIGFAERSGKLLTGSYPVEESIRHKKAKLILVATDVNPKRLEILKFWCNDMGVPLQNIGTKDEYGKLLKKRAVGLLALTDASMAKGIIQAVSAGRGD